LTQVRKGLVRAFSALAALAAYPFSSGSLTPTFIYSVRDLDSSDTGNREANCLAPPTSDWQPKYTAGVLAK
jgi:polysaccharide biosynthesis protein PslG